ncbi:FxSxx-COOH system tetratricopeptide repeat protein [Streptomyces sp. INR7]|uniref:FxSxx-COOH system tetratricopeptide repeat protein n=1 Tax=Streptomyces sp. INR7 TaxID=2607753 RepID=UPI00162922BD|nr:FxSxx-COOH system tetratricopeptide repeat protein [Streptomyces sp. INR7]QNE23439.1 tetratricopeptide repeat protein [Streptomyces sp. INR7]
MTNYASDAVPGWAAQAWVIWPVFAVLVVVSVGLLLWGRHLDAVPRPPARPAPVSRLARGQQASLRHPHVQRVRGREGELAVLTGMLRRPQGRFAVLCAVGGMGKTTVAAQLATQAEAAGWRVFWVRWRDGAELAQQMVQAALACGLPEAELEAARAGQASLPDVVWRQLGQVRRWLLVVDNADEPHEIGPAGEPVADYRGWIRPHGRGLLVVTSRDGSEQTWGPCAQLLPLEPLPVQPAGQVLLDAAPAAGTAEQARELAARLGGLPLALHAAGTYLAGPTSRYRTFAAYRQALEQELRFLLGAAHPNASRPQVARAVVRHTWEVSLDQLAGEGNALARPLLRLLALLAGAPVPLPLITPDLLSAVTGHDVTAVTLEAAFAGLHRYGLLGLPHSPGSTGLASGSSEEAQVVLHPLIREINAVALTAETSDLAVWHRALADRLTTAVHEANQRGRAGWPAAVLLAPHLPLLLDFADPRTATHHRTTLNTLAQVLQNAGAFGAARLLHERVLDVETRMLGPEHPDTLTSRNDLGNALFGRGEPAEAIRLLRQTLEGRTRVLGPVHPDTLTSRNDLACALDGTGEHAEAVDLLRQTLNDRTRVLGPEHPHTLASRDSLGLALDGTGEHAQAVRMHRSTLEDRIRVLGPEHHLTLLSRHNLAGALTRAGEQTEAIQLLRQALNDHARILGDEHPHTLASRDSLGLALDGTGEHAQAVRMHRRTLEDRTRILSPEHPDTLASRHNLALALASAGEQAEAIDLLRRTLDDRVRILGDEHTHTLSTRNALETALVMSAQRPLSRWWHRLWRRNVAAGGG